MVIFAVLYGQMQNLTQSIQTLNYLFLEGIFLHISIMILLKDSYQNDSFRE